MTASYIPCRMIWTIWIPTHINQTTLNHVIMTNMSRYGFMSPCLKRVAHTPILWGGVRAPFWAPSGS